MKPWNVAINNRVAVYILILIIVLLGVRAYLTMPREAAPDVTIPYIIVAVPYVGVSPIDMEGLVTQPLEREYKTLKDVKKITSSSNEGVSMITVEFNTGVEIDEALRRVRDKTSSTRSSLPKDIQEPVVTEVNISEFPILYVTVGGEIGNARLKTIADRVQERIEAVPGVISAEISGNLEPEVQINADLNMLKGYDISFDDLTNAIKAENITIPGGMIDNGTTDYTVRVPGEYSDPTKLRDIIVKNRNGNPIYMRDVAEVVTAFEDRKTYSRLNDGDVITLMVKKRAGENLIRIADEVRSIVDKEQAASPQGVSINVTNDQSVFVKRMVHELENSIMTGMALVILVLFMFFGVKNAMLISTSIPLSMLIGFIILSMMGITLNMVVLFTLVLVLGIVVDDAIVVIENIYRHQQEYGQNLIEAAKAATAEVAVPVATSTLTTVAAFIPLLFWPGIVGEFMSYLPITLISTMLASLFVAYVISPVQGSVFINYRKEIQKARDDLEHPHFYKKYNPFTLVYHWVDHRFFPGAQRRYVSALRLALHHRNATVVGVFVLLFVVIVLFGMFNSGVVFFPNTEPVQVSVSITMPPGTPLDVTNEATLLVERRVNRITGLHDIEFKTATVGKSNNAFDYGSGSIANMAVIAINFFEMDKRGQSTFTTLEEIRTAARNIPGADIKVDKQQMGPPVGAPISIEISGEDFSQLRALSNTVRSGIVSIPGLVDLKDDYNAGKPEIHVTVDREKAAMYELSTSQVAMMVRTAVNGTEASKYRVGDDEYKITVRLREDQRESVKDLETMSINFMNRRGALMSVPLTSVASVEQGTGLAAIKRKDMKRVITVTADAQGRLASDVLKDVTTRLSGLQLPDGYEISYSGEKEEQQKASSFLGGALLITLLLVFLILVTEFNSVKIPGIIMVSVLLSFIGVLVGLLVTGTPFSVIMTGVGVIALAGIVVKNAIVLLDFAKQLRKQGMPLEEALVEAGRVRLRPVVLTAIATMLGVFPLATGIDFNWRAFHPVFGGEMAGFWRPLGVAIIFGLGVSTFLTLIIVPTLYTWTDAVSARIGRFLRRLFGMKAKAPAAAETLPAK